MKHKILFIGVLFFPLASYAAGDAVQVQLNVDGCNNNSICEAVIGENQLSCPNDCTVTNTGGGNSSGSFPIPSVNGFFQNVSVVNGANKITITWQSEVPTLSVIRWGLTQDFRDGSIASTEFVKDHKVDLTNLIPGTFYYFTIDSRDAYNRSISLPYRAVFTLPLPDTTPPQNPSAFTALSSDRGIQLHWTNPTDADFVSVRITRNTDHYHASPLDGRLVYEGKGTTFIDRNVTEDKTYYYAIFAKDANGNYSTGAATTGKYVVYANPEIPEEPQQPPVVVPPVVIPPAQEETTTPFEKFTVAQGNGMQLSIPSSDLPMGTGDLWVNVFGPTGNISGQYLFSYNKQTGTYTASIPGTTAGNARVVVMAYRQGNVVELSEGEVTIPKITTEQPEVVTPENSKLFSIGIPLLLLALILLFRRRIFDRK